MLLGFALGACLITGIELGSRIDFAGRRAQEHVTNEGEHDTHGNTDVRNVKDGEINEGSGNKIGHEAKSKTVDRVANGAARNHRHAHNLKPSELRCTEQVHSNGDNDRQRQQSKRNTMPLAHAKGGTDITDKHKVDDTGDDGHMQSVAHGTNRKLGQLVKKQHNQCHTTSNT